ncbi:unnamed protein product [Sympodiomycopsis kandeliae]
MNYPPAGQGEPITGYNDSNANRGGPQQQQWRQQLQALPQTYTHPHYHQSQQLNHTTVPLNSATRQQEYQPISVQRNPPSQGPSQKSSIPAIHSNWHPPNPGPQQHRHQNTYESVLDRNSYEQKPKSHSKSKSNRMSSTGARLESVVLTRPTASQPSQSALQRRSPSSQYPHSSSHSHSQPHSNTQHHHPEQSMSLLPAYNVSASSLADAMREPPRSSFHAGNVTSHSHADSAESSQASRRMDLPRHPRLPPPDHPTRFSSLSGVHPTSTLSTPTGSRPAYGDAYISPQNALGSPESPDPLNLTSPDRTFSVGSKKRQTSPSPGGRWFSSQSGSSSGLEHAMGTSTSRTLIENTSRPPSQGKRRNLNDTGSSSKKKTKTAQGPSPVKSGNFYAVPPNAPRPAPPLVEVETSHSSGISYHSLSFSAGSSYDSSFSSRPSTPAKKSRSKAKASKAGTKKATLPPPPPPPPIALLPAARPLHTPQRKADSQKKKKVHSLNTTRFTTNLPLALPSDFDSDSAEEWDKDGDFEPDDGNDSDVQIVEHPNMQMGTGHAVQSQWHTPTQSHPAATHIPTTSVIKNAQRRSVLAKLADFIEEALEAESNLPDSSELSQGIPAPCASWFVLLDNAALLKPSKLQTLGRLIRSCAAIRSRPPVQSATKAGVAGDEDPQSLLDFETGELQKLLRLLGVVVRVGESVNPFPSTAAKASEAFKGSGPNNKKKTRKSNPSLSPEVERSNTATPSDDEDEAERPEKDEEQRAQSRVPDPSPTLTSKKAPTEAVSAHATVTEADQQALVEQLSRVSTSLMAVECCLSLLSVPHLDQSLLSEDLIRPCFEVLRSALELVIYPFVEACSSLGIVTPHPLLGAWIEALAPAGSSSKKGRKKKVAADFGSTPSTPVKNTSDPTGIFTASGEYLSRIFKTSCTCVTSAHKMMHIPSTALSESIIYSAIYAGIGPFFAIEPEVVTGNSDAAKLSSRARTAMEALAPGLGSSGEAMKHLRRPALDLLRDVFAQHHQQRQWIIEELLTSLTRLPDMKKNRRQHNLRNGRSINSITALLLQLIQTTAHGVRSRISPKARGTGASQTNAAARIPAPAHQGRHVLPEDEDDELDTVTAELTSDYDFDSLRHALDGPAQAAKAIATFLMLKVSPTKIVKISGDFSYASVVENLVADLLSSMFLPEWPAASLLLTSLCRAFYATVNDPKATPDARGVALEQSGNISAHVCESRMKMKTRQPTENSQAMGAKPTVSSVGDIERDLDVEALEQMNKTYMAVLDYLGAVESEDQASRSASDFLLSQWGSELSCSLLRTSQALDAARESKEEGMRAEIPTLQIFLSSLHQSLLSLPNYSTRADKAEQNVFGGDSSTTSYEEISFLAEQLNHTTSFAAHFDNLLGLLVDSLEAQAVGNRTKALRGLTVIYGVDPSLLDSPAVRTAIQTRLQDESAGVREAAVNLLSKHLLTQPEDYEILYNQLRERAADAGLAVRKRILKLLHSLYRTLPSASMRIDACLRIVERVNDEDVGIQDLAMGILSNIWLKIGSAGLEEPESSKVTEDAAKEEADQAETDVATELGDDVSIIVSVASRIRERPSPLEEVFRRFGNHKPSGEVDAKVAQRLRGLCDLLISGLGDDSVAEVDAVSGSTATAVPVASKERATDLSGASVLARIKTIHLVVSTNPAVLSIGKAKSLLPFVKRVQTAEDSVQLETLLRIFRESLPLMPKTALSFANQLELLLRPMLNNPPRFLGALQEIVACFATVVRCHTNNYVVLIKMMSRLLQAVRGVSGRLLQGTNVAAAGVDMKSSWIITETSLMCENVDLEAIVKENPDLKHEVASTCGERPFKDQMFELMLDIRQNSGAYSFLALQNICILFRGFPSLMHTDKGREVMTNVFTSSHVAEKEMLLKSFLEVLASDEVKNSAARSKEQTIEARKRDPARKETTGRKDKVDMDELVGNTDTFAESSVSSTLVAQYMDAVLQGSLSVKTPNFQRVAMDVLKYVVLQGLAHPLQCLPALISLETSDSEVIAKRALHMHQHLWSKHASLLAPRSTWLIKSSFEYQLKLYEGQFQSLRGYRIDPPTGCPVAVLRSWFSLLRDKRTTRLDFVRAMAKLMDIDTTSVECPEETVLLSRYIADNLATLDYKTMEEVFTVISELKKTLANTGIQVKCYGERFIRGLTDSVPLHPLGYKPPAADPISDVGLMQSGNEIGAASGNATLDIIDFGSGQADQQSQMTHAEKFLPIAANVTMPASHTGVNGFITGHSGSDQPEAPSFNANGNGRDNRTASDTARMSISMGTALLLRNHLKQLYGLSEDRCSRFIPGKKQSAAADRPAIRKLPGGEALSFHLMPLAFDSVALTPIAVEQLILFEQMMEAEGTLQEEPSDLWQEGMGD